MRAFIGVAVSLAILQYACAATNQPLFAPPSSHATAAQHNSEGIAHYEMGHWSIAKDHFLSAIESDANSLNPTSIWPWHSTNSIFGRRPQLILNKRLNWRLPTVR